MSDPTTTHPWMTRVARRISSSSVAGVLKAHVAPCVLDLLAHPRPQARVGVESIIHA
jgi:hypothetical protein